ATPIMAGRGISNPAPPITRPTIAAGKPEQEKAGAKTPGFFHLPQLVAGVRSRKGGAGEHTQRLDAPYPGSLHARARISSASHGNLQPATRSLRARVPPSPDCSRSSPSPFS